MKIGITGAAGFIGMHLASNLMEQGYEVTALDSFLPAYGGEWSQRRGKILEEKYNLQVKSIDLSSAEIDDICTIFSNCDVVIHLAAFPGVRQSQLVPDKYFKANILGFSTMLQAVRKISPSQFLYASSSSIYGDLAKNGPVKESDATGLNLKSYYAATKWMNEVEARSYAEMFAIPTTALRFFTVFGPWGRPDMAYWSFFEKLLKNEPVTLYGETGGSRNFTFVNDAVDIVAKLSTSEYQGSHRSLNIASGRPISTLDFLHSLSKAVNISSPKLTHVQRPSVDVEKTWADLDALSKVIQLPKPTDIDSATKSFAEWYLEEIA